MIYKLIAEDDGKVIDESILTKYEYGLADATHKRMAHRQDR